MSEWYVSTILPLVMLAFSVFFFNDTATTEIYTLSLHDALPISATKPFKRGAKPVRRAALSQQTQPDGTLRPEIGHVKHRSEEHTSELQSQSNLVCRLLLEKKKKTTGSIRSTHPSPPNITLIEYP